MTTSRPGSPLTDPETVGVTEAVANTTGSRILLGSFWNIASSVLPQIYLLLMSVVAARFLGPEDMGRQSFISFIALAATAFFGGGMASTLMRFVGETLGAGRPAVTIDLARWCWSLASLGAILGASAMTGIGLFGATPEAAWILAGLGCALGILQSIPNAVLIGIQDWRRASIVGLTTGSIGVPVTIAVLAAGGGIVGMFAVELAVIAANLAWSGALSRQALRRLAESPERDPQIRRRAAAYASWTLLSIGLSTIVFKRSEFFLLNHYASDADIATYSIAFAAVYAITTLSESLAQTLLPAFATLFGGAANARIETGFDRAQRLLMMFSLPLAAATIALGPAALVLIYGSDYSATGQVVQIMALGIPLLALMNLSHAFMLGLGKVRPLLAIDAIAAVVNVSFAFLLIPPLQDVGAALANLAGQCMVALIVTVYALRSMESVRLPLRVILRNAICAGIAGLLAYAAATAVGGFLGLLSGIVVGAACFIAVGMALKIIRSDDAGWLLDSTAGTRFAAPVALVCRLFAPRPAIPR